MAGRNEKRNGGNKPRQVLKPDDEALFMSAMKGVQRTLGQVEEIEIAEPSASGEPPPQPARTTRAKPAPAGPKKYSPLATGRSGDVDGRTLDKLKRGQLRPQARLDLHGMTQDEAHRALVSLMADAQAEGKRCVLVITGRGRVSEGGGVLRNQTPNWLNTPAIRSRILAFATAQPKDGGSGALYVLLRRIR
jgi:DNA-nicking Smr family endonuclease